MVDTINPLDHTGLVHFVVCKYTTPGSEYYDDLFQEGFIGLLIAIPKYDPVNFRASFGHYAYYWIRAYVLAYLKRQKPVVRYASTEYVEDPSGIYVEHTAVEEAVSNLQLLNIATDGVARYIDTASDRDIYLLTERWISDDPVSLTDVASEWGVSKQRVDEYERISLDKFRRAIWKHS